MYYDALKTFVQVVEEQSFSRAAEKLLISQPSVSVHIKNLENEFQTKLFVRSPKTFQITPTGEILYQRAIQMIQMYERAKRDIYEHHHLVKGLIKIGASFTIGEYTIPSFLAEMQADYPYLEFEIIIGNTDEIVELVKLFKVDIGLIEGQTNEKDLTIRPFLDDELVIIAPTFHPLTKKKEINEHELQNQNWITREKGSGTREFFDHVISAHGLKINHLMAISSTQGIKEAVINGLGLALISRSAVKRDHEHHLLSILDVKLGPFKRKFSIINSTTTEQQQNINLLIDALNKRATKQAEK
ncbi:LysR family transcriptional regulator [Bacillus sp. PS06]|uniref:LysR family transcriptional regulator n=1 Tax=Bacillus sp. PS06 TaxID=2764176 RepID=UPI00177A86A2|nr:LysR family transcriptional regulator [Bacillus sp. PS06]MBD8068530.1 LysR family transcriptional regulator [Bacillus sp. PS06]